MRVPSAAALIALLGVAADHADPFATRSKGLPDARLVVYELADFQCPACRSFALETMPVLDREYVRTGKLRWVFLNLPLTEIHPHAVPAAEVAMCAARQDKFWEVHDALFLRQPHWAALSEPGPYLVALAESVGVARNALIPCLQSGDARRDVERDATQAQVWGARLTPSFLVGDLMMEGSAPAGLFRHLLDSLYLAASGRH